MTNHHFHPTMLREYDIRGIVGDTLHAADAYAIGRSFGTLIRRAGGSRVALGYDGRLSSPMLAEALSAGLMASGCTVLGIGQAATPMLYFATHHLSADGGIEITGSHNPPDHNGFKFVANGAPFYGQQIQQLGRLAAAGDWDSGEGAAQKVDVFDAYIDRLVEGFAGSSVRVGWDAGNGAAGPAVEALVKRLPGEHFTLFTAVDGHFPNHHPDPTEEKNLVDLRALVADKKLDFGLAFDGDGDRIGAIDGEGRIIWGDQLLQIFSEMVLKEVPGGTIIADVKASKALFDRVAALGGKPLMWKTGHSLIKAKMKEVGSPLAGEMSGHIFFAHGYYGFDDALFAAVKLIEAPTLLGRTVTQLRGAMAPMVNTPELRFQVDESRKFAVIDEVLARLAAGGVTVDRTDGARVTTATGWWLLRASNTQDVLVARAEASDAEGLAALVAEIDRQLMLSGIERGALAAH
ncbi:MAG: phosphomannomutase/phosphoglucomutase [Sphingopyxis sp.]